MKNFSKIILSLLLLVLTVCCGNDFVYEEFSIKGNNMITFLKEPRENVNLPSILIKDIFEDACVHTDTANIISTKSVEDYSANVNEGISKKYDAKFFAKIKEDISIASGFSSELLKKLEFNITAKGTKIIRVNPSQVVFSESIECIEYLKDFSQNEQKLLLETIFADTISCHISNLHNDSLQVAVEAKLADEFGSSFDYQKKAAGNYTYNYFGKGLTFGYKSHSFKLKTYKNKIGTHLDVEVGKQVYIPAENGFNSVKAFKIEQVGDDKTYQIVVKPFYGNSKFKRLAPGEVGIIRISNSILVTVDFIEVENNIAKIDFYCVEIEFE